jgi:hypothetical protein
MKYRYIKLCLGYPKSDDTERIIWRKWNGVKLGNYETDLFGEIYCFAIDVTILAYQDQHWGPCFQESYAKKSIITLNLKRKYWEQIRDGEKKFEYRENKDYWRKRLI